MMLAHMANASRLQRKTMIAELEAQGFTISWYAGCYRAKRGEESYSAPRRPCERCRKTVLLSELLCRQDSSFISPWCVDCRRDDPKGAKRAGDRSYQHWRYEKMRHDDPERLRKTWEKQRQAKQRKRLLKRLESQE